MTAHSRDEKAAGRQPFAYRPALDGLRGVAILMVMADHAGLYAFTPALGGAGVTAFFVLSGFLITTLLLEERQRTGTIALRRFYRRRGLRLLPALVEALAFVSIIMLVLGRSNEIIGDVAPAFFYVANITKAAGGDLGLLSHVWTLSIEGQFYLIWPAILIGLLAIPRIELSWIAGSAVGLAVAVMIWRVVAWAPEAYAHVYWSTDTRADSLLVGCALAAVSFVKPLRIHPLIGLGALVVIIGVGVLADRASFAVIGIAAVGIAAACVISDAATGPSRLLSWKPLVHVGSISYGLYLLHRPVMRLGTDLGLGLQPIPVAVMVAVSFVLAWASWRYVERPFLSLKSRAPASDSRMVVVVAKGGV